MPVMLSTLNTVLTGKDYLQGEVFCGRCTVAGAMWQEWTCLARRCLFVQAQTALEKQSSTQSVLACFAQPHSAREYAAYWGMSVRSSPTAHLNHANMCACPPGASFSVGDVAVGSYLLYLPLFFPDMDLTQVRVYSPG